LRLCAHTPLRGESAPKRGSKCRRAHCAPTGAQRARTGRSPSPRLCAHTAPLWGRRERAIAPSPDGECRKKPVVAFASHFRSRHIALVKVAKRVLLRKRALRLRANARRAIISSPRYARAPRPLRSGTPARRTRSARSIRAPARDIRAGN
jgi:hypothetical protein